MVYQIAIDGPSGAGKSTVAMAVAKALGIDYIDTGAMYRAVALAMMREGIDVDDEERLEGLLEDIDINFKGGQVLLDGEIVDDQIRNERVAKLASDASALGAVRQRLVSLQRSMGERRSVILDGRDIGSNVFPDARYKFYLVASCDERAKRRYHDLAVKDPGIGFEDVKRDIEQRDYNDTHRSLNPLVKVDDAIQIDTTGNTVEESAKLLLGYIKEYQG